jgi:hypothetical protein
MAAVSVRNLEALVKLATKLVGRLLSRPFQGPARPEDVLTLYADDRVALIPEQDRAKAARLRQCTGCGECDVVGDLGMAPSLLVLRLCREGQDASEITASELAPVSRQIAELCPERVDVPQMVLTINRRLKSS